MVEILERVDSRSAIHLAKNRQQ